MKYIAKRFPEVQNKCQEATNNEQASFVRTNAELQPSRSFIPFSRKPLLKSIATIQQHAAQEPPGRRSRLERRCQASKLTPARCYNRQRPPIEAILESDWAADISGGQGWEFGFEVGKAEVH
ncbi:RNA binding (RRM/RBD/RNP motifs) family protein [Striga asiatica]|uniref:RNA binding (RRM/RBD/RNP motifs) family protein n=1 Tax=Striga asiatica TaxID=4170 RepID=A0A5A7PEP1_STRAF|nr:RNA binding (RRM/RBD/RNP motifs) family protein [Striga asiatica]